MRKKLRLIVVDGKTYSWGCRDLYSTEWDHLVVFATKNGQPLKIDPYPWDFAIRPGTVADAIRFAIAHGWKPDAPGAPLYIAWQTDRFIVLPDSVQFVSELGKPPPA